MGSNVLSSQEFMDRLNSRKKDEAEKESESRVNASRSGLEVLLTEKELAPVIKYEIKTLQSWRYKGAGPLWEKLEGGVRYRPSDIVAWLDSSRCQSTSQQVQQRSAPITKLSANKRQRRSNENKDA